MIDDLLKGRHGSLLQMLLTYCRNQVHILPNHFEK
jgi:hypothetical protein